MRDRKFHNFSIWTLLLLTIIVHESQCTHDRKTDEYLSAVQSDCYSSKKLFSCFKYRVARYVWSFATGRINIFDYENESKEFANGVKIVQLAEPDTTEIFADARQSSNDNEIGKLVKFLKRSMSTFIDGHGLRIGIGTDKGPRVLDINSTDDGRKLKKKNKWNLIFPLAILIKLFHLKLILLPIILGLGLLQVLVVAGGGFILYFLKNNTLCRIQPHLVHSHSHVTTEGGPEIGGGYSAYGGYPSFGGSGGGYSHGGSFNKDWATNRAYSAYSFLDAINQH